VGFRPFVHTLATRCGIGGHVLNDSAGVTIEIEGEQDILENFITSLTREAPPLALIEEVIWESVPLRGSESFLILPSDGEAERQTFISPDVCVCEDCLREMFDPADRRFLYPFINCTNCGPRFTIIKNVPYDRCETTMASFAMCDECRQEFEDASNRRFHAQPNACPVCGPQVKLITSKGEETGLTGVSAIAEAQRLLQEGAIVAIKGLGGYHLASDACNEKAVAILRSRKHREDKPFALMAPDLNTIGQFCEVNENERSMLCSRHRPIVLLRKRRGTPIAHAVAPGNRYLGFMLPYTPLHYLLFHNSLPSTPGRCPVSQAPDVLVMTSGNVSDEPIAYRDDDAIRRLGNIADFFLTHNRAIHVRCDDSVLRVVQGRTLFVRRSRGYVPRPLLLPFEFPRPILAVGGHLKNTFCLVKGRHAFISQHIGDLENLETLTAFAEGIGHFMRLFDIRPRVIAHDMHPEYLSTRWAKGIGERRGFSEKIGDGIERLGFDSSDPPQLLAVQHHHAHIASVVIEHGIEEPVIGVSFDGTGYGADGTIWGGEILRATLSSFQRVAHLLSVPLPGGEAAVKEPWRMAAVWLWHVFGDNFTEIDIPFLRTLHRRKWRILQQMIEKGINSPLTSSMGRLFDAVAALVGIRQTVNYEGQAAVELEQCAEVRHEESYRFAINDETPRKIDPSPAIRALVADLQASVSPGIISARFHNAIAESIREVCLRERSLSAIHRVALSGGVFQNVLLLERTRRLLEDEGFEVYVNEKVPPNDGGISLGQAAIAAARLMERG